MSSGMRGFPRQKKIIVLQITLLWNKWNIIDVLKILLIFLLKKKNGWYSLESIYIISAFRLRSLINIERFFEIRSPDAGTQAIGGKQASL